MAKNIKELSDENEKLNEENNLLQLLLRKALETIEVFKSDKIDASVIADEKAYMYAEQLKEVKAELERANEELCCQIEEKEKRGAELTIARSAAHELEELNSHKEKVLATLSHDLRSPLTGIIGLAEIIKENFETFENNLLKEMLDLLYKSTTDELNMLDSMVEWARIKYASEAFSPEKIKLTQAVKKAFETINENAVIKYIHFNNEIEDSIYVFADRKMLLSILQNIVSNSLKHTPNGGKITISARRKEDKIIIGIKDTGTGMSEEIMKNLFTPQIISLSNERKDGNGAGIGLLLVKSFIEQNGGEIWAESIEGEGSSLYFTLPAKEQRKMNMQFLNSRNDLVMERPNLQRQL